MKAFDAALNTGAANPRASAQKKPWRFSNSVKAEEAVCAVETLLKYLELQQRILILK